MEKWSITSMGIVRITDLTICNFVAKTTDGGSAFAALTAVHPTSARCRCHPASSFAAAVNLSSGDSITVTLAVKLG
jgi:hypothetical protein